MLDALELRRCLTSEDQPYTHSTIAAYESQMRVRAAVAAKDSLKFLDAVHSPNAISSLLALFA